MKMDTVDKVYEVLKKQKWFKGLSLDRQGELCILISKDTRMRAKVINKPMDEIFSNNEIINAIISFLEFGEDQFGKSQGGYFSGPGFAARALRFHLKKLEEKA